jgi:hypothetical protein
MNHDAIMTAQRFAAALDNEDAETFRAVSQ